MKTTKPKKVDFTNARGPDYQAMMAIQAGLSYKAAARITGLGTPGRISYRLRLLQGKVSSKAWRNGQVKNMSVALLTVHSQTSQCDELVSQIKALLDRLRKPRSRRK